MPIKHRRDETVGRLDLDHSCQVSKVTHTFKVEKGHGFLPFLSRLVALAILILVALYFLRTPNTCCAICGEPVFWSQEEYVKHGEFYYHTRCAEGRSGGGF